MEDSRAAHHHVKVQELAHGEGVRPLVQHAGLRHPGPHTGNLHSLGAALLVHVKALRTTLNTSNLAQHVYAGEEQTSTMASVIGVAPMAARSVDRMRDESSSLQSCRIVRITHTSPACGRGSISAQQAHTQALLAAAWQCPRAGDCAQYLHVAC